MKNVKILLALGALLSFSGNTFTMEPTLGLINDKNADRQEKAAEPTLVKITQLQDRINRQKERCLNSCRYVKMCDNFILDAPSKQTRDRYIIEREQEVIEWRNHMDTLKSLCRQRDALQ